MEKSEHWSSTRRLLDVERIRLWKDNPRLNRQHESRQQKEIIESIFEQNNDSFKKLILSIAENGFMYFDTVVVCKLQNEDNFFTVIEGNRRIAAMKLLLNPNLAPKKYKATIEKYSKDIDSAKLKKVYVSIAPLFDTAILYITNRHTTREVVPWSPENKRNWIMSLYERCNHDIEKIVEVTGLQRSDIYGDIISISLLDYTKKLFKDEIEWDSFSVTNFERFVFSKTGKEYLGIEVEFDKILLKKGRDYFDDILKKLAEAIAGINGNKKLDSRKLDKVENYQEIIDTILQTNQEPTESKIIICNGDIVNADLPVMHDIAPINKPEAANITKEKRNAQKNPHERIIQNTLSLHTDNQRLLTVFNELQNLPQKYNVAIAVTLRVFIDLAVQDYLERNNSAKADFMKKRSPSNRAPTASERLRFLADYEQLGLPREVKGTIKKFLDDDHLYSLDTLNSYTHGTYTPLTYDLIKQIWISTSEFLKKILDITENK